MTAAAIRLDAPVQRLANCTALMIAYIPARIQLVVKRRMKASNLVDVGHILSRNGTSTKMRMRPETLRSKSSVSFLLLFIQSQQTPGKTAWQTYMHMILKIIRIALNEKMLAMPTARQMTIDTIPALKAKISIHGRTSSEAKVISDATKSTKHLVR